MTGNRIAAVELKGSATGNQGIYLRAYKNASGSSEQGTISIAFDWTKNLFVTSAPTPPHADKSTQIATTAWVKDLIATTSEYGLMKVATPETAIDPDENDAAITPAVYHDVSDFRHKGTAYSLGDKVECMFNHELFLECTQAGTTSSTPLDTRNVTHGQVLTDGTVQWTVRTHIKSVNGVVAGANGDVVIEIPKPIIASQAEAEAGTDDTKMMTPLKVKQSILKTTTKITSGTTDLTPNTSPLATGEIYLVYE